METYEFDKGRYRNVAVDAFIQYLRNSNIRFTLHSFSALSRYFRLPYKVNDLDIRIESSEAFATIRVVEGFIGSSEYTKLLENEGLSEFKLDIIASAEEYCYAEFGEDEYYFTVQVCLNGELAGGHLEVDNECIYSLGVYLEEALDDYAYCEPRLCMLFPLFYILDAYRVYVPEEIAPDWFMNNDYGEEWAEAMQRDFKDFFDTAGVKRKVNELIANGEISSFDDFFKYIKTLRANMTEWAEKVVCAYGGTFEYKYSPEDENEVFFEGLYSSCYSGTGRVD